MFVSEILSENEGKFTVQQFGIGKDKVFNIINPDGNTVGSEKQFSRAKATADKLTKQFKKANAVKQAPTTKPVDDLKAKANKATDIDRRKGKDAAQNYLDKKKPKKRRGIKELGKKFYKYIGPQARGLGTVFQLYMGYEDIGNMIRRFNDVYIEAGCNGSDPKVNAYQYAVAEEVTSVFISSAASFAAGGAAATQLKRIKNLKSVIQLMANYTLLAPAVGWIARIISFIGIEAAFYALGKVLGSSAVAEGLANMFRSKYLSKQQMVDYGRFLEPDLYKLCDANKTENFDNSSEEELFVETVSKTAVKKDVMKIIKDDPKLMKMIKKVKKETKAKAT
tara:strand:- start:3729 stop:4736 length:1008 start_codon:yes stop_codon:yes gene_type:complete